MALVEKRARQPREDRRGPPSDRPRPAFGDRPPRAPGAARPAFGNPRQPGVKPAFGDRPERPGYQGNSPSAGGPNKGPARNFVGKKPMGPNLASAPTKKSYVQPKRKLDDRALQFRGARGSLKRKGNKKRGVKAVKVEDRPVLVPDGPMAVSALAKLIDK